MQLKIVASTALIALAASVSMARADLTPNQDTMTYLQCSAASGRIRDKDSFADAITKCETSIVYYAKARAQSTDEDGQCRNAMYIGASYMSSAYVLRYSTKAVSAATFETQGKEYLQAVIEDCTNEPVMQKTAAHLLDLETQLLDK
jgi:hypothetical protein